MKAIQCIVIALLVLPLAAYAQAPVDPSENDTPAPKGDGAGNSVEADKTGEGDGADAGDGGAAGNGADAGNGGAAGKAANADQPPEGFEFTEASVVDFRGRCFVRQAPDGRWAAPTKGMKLEVGASLRTLPRSFISVHIAPDHLITLQHTGTLDLLTLAKSDQKTIIDMGMKYGRVDYVIQTAGRDHETKVHSPGAVLAVRGTVGYIQNRLPQRPFLRVVSERRVTFDELGRRVNMMKGTLVAGNDSPAHTSRKLGTLDNPKGMGQTDRERGLSIEGNTPQGLFDGAIGMTAARGFATTSGLPRAPVFGGNLIFALGWAGDLPTPASNVDLQVTDPDGNMFTPASAGRIGTGQHSGDDTGSSGSGLEQVVFRGRFPNGAYNVEAIRQSGANATYQLDVFQEKPSGSRLIRTQSGRLTSSSPTAGTTVTLPTDSLPQPAQQPSVPAQPNVTAQPNGPAN